MNNTRRRFIVPVLVTVSGLTWLMNVLNIIPEVNWLIVGGLATIGVLVLFVGGVNKLTVVFGPFLMIASVCSLLTYTGALERGRGIPVLMVALGGLLLLSQVLKVPLPDFLRSEG